MRRILRICKIAWTKYGNYPDSLLSSLLLFDSGQEYRPAPFFPFPGKVICRFSRFATVRKPRLSLRSRDNSVREPNAQPAPATGLFKGFGTLSQQAKTGFRRSRRKPVLSICGNKYTACQVAHPQEIRPAVKKLWLRKPPKYAILYFEVICLEGFLMPELT